MPFNVVEIIFKGKNQAGDAIKGVNNQLRTLSGTVTAARVGMAGLFAAIAVGTLKELADGVRAANKEIADMAATAQRLNIAPQLFSELQFAAISSGVALSALEGGVRAFDRRIREAAEGTGALAFTLERMEAQGLGVALFDDAGDTLRDTGDVLETFLDRLSRVTDETERNRIALAAFDVEGTSLVNIVRAGAGAFAEMQDEARRLGVSIENDVAESSRDAEKTLSVLDFVIKQNLTRTVAELTPIVIDATEALSRLAIGAANFITTLRDTENISPADLVRVFGEEGAEDRIRERRQVLERELTLWQEQLAGYQAALKRSAESGNPLLRLFDGINESQSAEASARIAELETRLRQLDELFQLIQKLNEPVGPDPGDTDRATRSITRLSDEIRRMEQRAELARTEAGRLREELALAFAFENEVAKAVNGIEGLEAAVKQGLKDAAKQGPAALRRELEESGLAATSLGRLLEAAIRAYRAELNDARREQAVVFREALSDVSALKAAIEGETLALALTIDGDETDANFQRGLAAARATLVGELAQLEKARKAGVSDQDLGSTNQAAVERFNATLIQLDRNREDQRRKIRQEFLLQAVDDEERAALERQFTVEEFWRQANDAVRAGIIDQQTALDGYRQLWMDLEEQTNEFATAFDRDLREVALDAMEEFGDRTQDLLVDLVTGAGSASDVFQEFFANIAAAAFRTAADLAVSGLFDTILEGLTRTPAPLPPPGGEGIAGVGGDNEAADKQVQAAGQQIQAANTQQSAASSLLQTLTGGLLQEGIKEAIAFVIGQIRPAAPAAPAGGGGGVTTMIVNSMTQPTFGTVGVQTILPGQQFPNMSVGASTVFQQEVKEVALQVVLGSGGGGGGGGFASAQDGGFITRDGLVNLHAGEVVKDETELRRLIEASVQARSGPTVNMSVNVAADGTARVQQDSTGGEAEQFADSLSLAVVTELRKQQQPGGLLEGTGRR